MLPFFVGSSACFASILCFQSFDLQKALYVTQRISFQAASSSKVKKKWKKKEEKLKNLENESLGKYENDDDEGNNKKA